MDYIVRELNRKNIPFYRLNTENISAAKCRIGHLHIDDWSIDNISGQDIKAAYFRRPGSPFDKLEQHYSSNVSRYLSLEWHAFLKSLYGRLEGKWLNSPNDISLAEDKPKQLLLAKQVGFSVPDNTITNDVIPALKLFNEKPLIAKPLKQALIEEESEKVIFTNQVENLELEDEESLKASPVIFQQEIAKACDLRVTVVGKNVFAVSIDSQVNEKTKVDWRKGGELHLKHEVVELPEEVKSYCVELTHLLGLKFGAIDLIRDATGKHWFLEINPNGQWAWIENQTRSPISQKIVEELISIGESN
ncbi:hypothetical protein LNL84_04345 [Vibrio sp. ZSDZ34]|uniref:ATP-grasp domain-containing protein n=1 Tax=Vibrio gelatinilyticus TaxID=2893468 RepID=A0A9X1WBG0_9VIBR|nr:hypothetical protein [Vibrio gelatinilyticus]MCJ2376058.1 hypothetical protein [Vibrio gelatinilyticus]